MSFFKSAFPAWCLISMIAEARQIDFQGDPSTVPGTVTESGFTPVTASALATGIAINGVTFRAENFAPSNAVERDRGVVADQGNFTYGDLLDDCIQLANTTNPATTGRLLITGLRPSRTYSLRIWSHDSVFNHLSNYNFTETTDPSLSGTILNRTGGPYLANTDYSFQVTISNRSSVTYAISSPDAGALTKISGLVLVERGTLFEAENGAYSPMVFATNHSGFSGTGFLDFPTTANNDYVEWNVRVERPGGFLLTLGYANQPTSNRPMRFWVNGTSVNPAIDCASTASWTNWVDSAPVPVTLPVGNHVIRAQVASNAIQGPNVDYLRVTPQLPAAIQLAQADHIEVPLNGSNTFNPSVNDSLPLPREHRLLSLGSLPTKGSATINPQTGTISYTHTDGTPGIDQLVYTTTDITGVSSSATVSFVIGNFARVANTTLTLPPDAPAGGQLQVVDALPGLTFIGAVGMATVPGFPKSLLVASINGAVWLVPDTTLPNPRSVEILNVASLSNFTRGRSIYGITCHPDFANNGQIILNYQGDLSGLPPLAEIPNISNLIISEKATPRREIECTLRISRFTLSPSQLDIYLNPASSETLLTQTRAAVLATEFRYLNLAEEHAYHSINDCKFGTDGYLYVSFGDEGAQGEPYRNAQFITKDQYSSIIRIDLDRKSENLEPNPHYSIVTDNGTARFKIPADNPYTGPAPIYNGQAIATADIPKVRTEIYATGFRNPFKFEIDPPTGEIWVGDVGMDRWEEVSIIQKGDNAGWSYWEGNEQRSNILHAIPPSNHKVPEYAYLHANGNVSVTGGVLYRGSAYTSLQNKYIFGDFGSGRIWSLTRATESTPTNVTEMPFGVPAVVDFEVDPATGQILILQHNSGRRVMRLIEGSPGSTFPQLLSQTGTFADLETLEPHPGIVAYQSNLSFWSDHAIKQRYFAIKNTTDTLAYSRDDNWTYPAGMVFIKHFDIDLNRDAPGSNRKRLETRFLVRNEQGAYGVSYRWNEDQTDATLVPTGGADFDLQITENGQPVTQRWRIPSRSDCLTCHTPAAGHALSFNTPQLNRDGAIGNLTGNFLTLLSETGYLTGLNENPANLPRHHRPDETDIDLETRVRSYLDVNCSYCHHPDSGTPALWDGRIHPPLTDTSILYGQLVSQAYHDPDDFVAMPGQPARSAILSRIKARDAIGDGRFNGYSQMPPLASNVVDQQGAALIEQWLLHHANVPPNFSPVIPDEIQESDAATLGTVIGTLSSLDPDIRVSGNDQSLIRYQIISGNHHSLFSLHPETGVLRVNGVLHYHRQDTHQLTITATDQFAANPGTSTHILTINLSDAGDKDLDNNGLPDLWETGYNLVGASAGADSNRDGIRDYFDYLTGKNPQLPATSPPLNITAPSDLTGSNGLTLHWRFRNGLLFGSDYFLQGSSSMSQWSDLAPGIDFEILESIPDGEGFTRITIRTLAAGGHYFLRLSNKPSGTPLFNGTNLAGWEIKQGSLAMYQVVPASGAEPAYIEGTANGNLGMLATTAQYGDFDLQYEFWVDDPLNSGVQIRSFMNNGAVKGYQVEIDPSSRAWSGGLYEQNGRTWLNDLSANPAARAAFLPAQWNRIRVLAQGNHIRTWINGVPATNYIETLANIPATGFLAIQVHQGNSSIHGKKIRIRNIRITAN